MANKDFKVKNGLDIQSPLPVSMGGTGQTSTTNTLNSLLPSQVGNSGKFLTSDGTNTSWIANTPYSRGTTAQRPQSPTAGDLYFNTDKKCFQVYNGSAWTSLIVNGAVPDAPTINSVTLTGLTGSVAFTGPTDFGDAAISSYTVSSSPSSTSSPSATSPISVSGLSANTSYSFTLTATNSYGTSLASSAVSATTANVPGAPTSVSASDPGTDGYALVSWTAPASTGGSAITDYTIQYSSDSGSSWTTFSDGTSTSTSATVTGLTTGTAYTFRVAAVNAIGTGSYSTASSSFTPTTHDSGSMFPIRSYIVPSGGVASIEWTSIPSTYTHLQIRYIARFTTAVNDAQQFYMQFNSDTASNYSDHILGADINNPFAAADTNVTKIGQMYGAGGSSTAGKFGAGIIDILDYTSTNKAKTTKTAHGFDNNAAGYVGYASGLWFKSPAEAITSIKFLPPANNFAQYSSFALYGVKA